MNVFAIIGIVLAVLFVVLLVILWGFLVNLMLPKRYSAIGEKVSIFLDGVYNRDATISGIGQEKIVIYDRLPLPIAYRGKFYAVGCDRDGIELWYMANKRLYWLVPYAERIRKRYKLIDCPFNFVPVSEELPVEPVEATDIESTEESEDSTDAQPAEEGTDDES